MIITQTVLTCDICGHHRVTDEDIPTICKSWVILQGGMHGKKCLCMRCTSQVLRLTSLRDHVPLNKMAQDDSEPLREWLKHRAGLNKRSARNGRV